MPNADTDTTATVESNTSTQAAEKPKSSEKSTAVDVFLEHNQTHLPSDGGATTTLEQLREATRAVRKSDGVFGFIPPDISAERKLRMNKPAQFAGRSMDIFNKASVQFLSREQTQIFKGEREYTLLFEDIRDNEKDWFIFLEDERQFVYAERCVGMLGTLATIHRARGGDELGRSISPENNEKCHEILAIDEKLLSRYREMLYNYAENRVSENIHCYENLYYKFCRIRLNLWSQELKQDDSMLPIIREGMKYEFKHGGDDFTFMLNCIDKDETLAELNRTSESGMKKMAKEFLKMRKNIIEESGYAAKVAVLADTSDKRAVEQHAACSLAICAYCSEVEPCLNRYKKCSQCRLVKYCSVDCQKKHWKDHKISCSK